MAAYLFQLGDINHITISEAEKMDENEYLIHNQLVVFDISANQNIVAKIKFSYSGLLDVILVRAQLMDSFENVPSSFICSQLFSGDNGLTSPNPESAYIQDGCVSNR